MHEPKSYRAIMVSSTFTDLKQHRKKVISAIQNFGAMANVMEYSGARADLDVIDSSLEMVRDSAAYIGVISLKYGQTPVSPERNPDQLSITELEFNEAMRLKRPILLFIMADTHPVIAADVELDLAKRAKLGAFRERAKRMREGGEVNRIYEMFDSVEHFSEAATTAVGKLVPNIQSAQVMVVSTSRKTFSNIPISVPRHFLGRDEDLAAIQAALKGNNSRVAITALHGLRGVGKTALAAAYAERHAADYRATWWVRAETKSTTRADLVGLGVKLGWIAADEKEEPALATVMQRLRDEGEGILIVYDNARSANEIRPHIPAAGSSHAIVTSNAPDWRGVAAPVSIKVWPSEVGADYLMARTGRDRELAPALALSGALGGLPLAHEQAGAYCERVGVSFDEYLKRFKASPARVLDAEMDAPAEYHDRMTVAKTFALAIDEAAKLNPTAEALVMYAALLAAEPIPLYLFSEARGQFGELFASELMMGGLDEAVATLRSFALVDRESIADERNSSITTDCIRLHRLVLQVAKARLDATSIERLRRKLIRALATVYPAKVYDDPITWPRARRLDALALGLVEDGLELPEGAEASASSLLNRLAAYREGCLAAYDNARPMYERALVVDERLYGKDNAKIAVRLNNLSNLLQRQGDLTGARHFLERALEINERTQAPDFPGTAACLCNLGMLVQEQGDLELAHSLQERALHINERVHGPNHPVTANILNNIALLLQLKGDDEGARNLFERALTIHEKELGSDHPATANSLINLGVLLGKRGAFMAAQSYLERGHSINEKVLGVAHPRTAVSLHNLGTLQKERGNVSNALFFFERALAILETTLGPRHRETQIAAQSAAFVLAELERFKDAKFVREKFGLNGKSDH